MSQVIEESFRENLERKIVGYENIFRMTDKNSRLTDKYGELLEMDRISLLQVEKDVIGSTLCRLYYIPLFP